MFVNNDIPPEIITDNKTSNQLSLAAINAFNEAAIKKQLDAKKVIYTQYQLLLKQKQMLLNNIIWVFVSFCFLVCAITFLIFSCLNIVFNAGFNADNNSIIILPIYLFSSFLILNLIPLFFLATYFNKNKIKQNNYLNFLLVFLLTYLTFITCFYLVYKWIKLLKITLKEIRFYQQQVIESYKHSSVFYLALVGILLAVFLLVKYIFSLFKVFSGWSIEANVMVYILCMIIIPSPKASFFFCFLAPLLALPLSADGLIYPLQVVFEYILTYWVFLPLMFFYKFASCVFNHTYFTNLKKNIKIQKLLILVSFSFLLLIFWSLKLFLHILAGVLWWTNNNWTFSAFLNAQVILGSFAICLPFSIAAILPMLKLRKFYNNNNNN